MADRLVVARDVDAGGGPVTVLPFSSSNVSKTPDATKR